jgi:hypothetical protein
MPAYSVDQFKNTITPHFYRCAQDVDAGTKEHIQEIIAQVPDPAKSALEKLFQKNYSRLSEGGAAYQKVGFTLAYDLGITDTSKLIHINNAACVGSIHSLVLDNIVDNGGNPDAVPIRDTYLAHLLSIFYLNELKKISPENWEHTGADEVVKHEINTYSALYEEELYHVRVATSPYPRTLISRKCSPIKEVVGELLALTGRHDLKDDLFNIIDDASFVLCSLDDLLDWEEDLDRRRYTYPIQLCLDEMETPAGELSSEELKKEIFSRLIFGQQYHAIMKELCDILVDCSNRCEPISKKLQLYFTTVHEIARTVWQEHIRFLISLDEHEF